MDRINKLPKNPIALKSGSEIKRLMSIVSKFESFCDKRMQRFVLPSFFWLVERFGIEDLINSSRYLKEDDFECHVNHIKQSYGNAFVVPLVIFGDFLNELQSEEEIKDELKYFEVDA